jgi:hypothetical protein
MPVRCGLLGRHNGWPNGAQRAVAGVDRVRGVIAGTVAVRAGCAVGDSVHTIPRHVDITPTVDMLGATRRERQRPSISRNRSAAWIQW